MNRDSMIFYRSFYESVEGMSAIIKAEVYDAIFKYALDFKEPEFTDNVAKALFTLIKPQLDANIKRFENGKKPKTKQSESKAEAKQKQKISKSEANNNVNVNDNKEIYIPEFSEFLAYAVQQVPIINKEDVKLKYESWKVNDWSVTVNNKTRKIVNWKSTLLNTLPYLRKDESKIYTPNIVHE